MHRPTSVLAFAVATALVLRADTLQAQETSHAVTGGGISVPGWMGMIDARESSSGQTLNNAKLTKEGDALHVVTGPAVAYWHPDHKASGDYTISATFREPKFMGLNDHAHPYGLFIGGTDMGKANQSYLYCAAYGNGNFIVRGFGPAAFMLNGGHGAANAAVHTAKQGEPVTQQIAMSVKGNSVSCAINGVTVATYDKSAVVGNGHLRSTDGVYGIRFAHNTEAVVSGLKMTKP